MLVAASLLAMGKTWSDLAAVSLICFVYLFAMWNGSWQWSFLSKYEPYFVGSYESQYLLALVILCVSVFYLMVADHWMSQHPPRREVDLSASED